MAPLISVIVPVFNVERYLDECIISIRKQTYAKLQILLIEDCSTDDSLRVLEPHLADARIKLIRHDMNRGLSAARNTGIEAATGEYVMFVDSDDVIDALLIKACVDCVSNTNADLVTYGFSAFEDGAAFKEQNFDVTHFSEMGKVLGEEYFALSHFAWLKFIRRDLLGSPDMRFPVGLYYEDWPFHWSLGLEAKTKYQLPAKLYYYRQRGSSITGSTGKKMLDLFAVHSLVMERLKGPAYWDVRTLLANKMLDSHWRVLTRIDANLLPLAIKGAKGAQQAMRLNGFLPRPAWRRRLITLAICLPSSITVVAIGMLRGVLRFLSPQRRRASSLRVRS